MPVVSEMRATCQACGHVWHYKSEDRLTEATHDMQCCPCLLPFQPKPKVPTSRCPRCGSSAIKRERVEHRI